jgi:hypothetical protein
MQYNVVLRTAQRSTALERRGSYQLKSVWNVHPNSVKKTTTSESSQIKSKHIHANEIKSNLIKSDQIGLNRIRCPHTILQQPINKLFFNFHQKFEITFSPFTAKICFSVLRENEKCQFCFK